MMDITSRDNPLIKRWRKLSSDAGARRKDRAFVLEGARLCADAAASGADIDTLLFTETAAARCASAVADIRAVSDHAFLIPDALGKTIGDTDSPQGIFCLCRMREELLSPETTDPAGRYLMLCAVRDPGNLGTIIRTAEAFGADGLILSADCCDRYAPKVLRASMGGALRLPMCSVQDPAQTLRDLSARGMTSFACVTDGDAVPVSEASLGGGTICVIGNEANGIAPEITAACDRRLTIPMRGRAESLNASMAAGIVLWELCRL